MPTIDWLKKEFSYGYDSGDILSIFPWRRRGHSRNLCGGSHRGIFFEAIKEIDSQPDKEPDEKPFPVDCRHAG